MKDKELILSRLYDKIRLLITKDGFMGITNEITCVKLSKSNDISCHDLYNPAVIYLINGYKQTIIGDEVVDYKKGQMFINTINLPANFKIMDASEDNPHIAIKVNIKSKLLAQVMQGMSYKFNNEDVKDMSDRAFTSIEAHYYDLCTLERMIDLSLNKCTDSYPFMLLIRELYYYWLTNNELAPLVTNYVVKRNISVIKALDYISKNYHKNIVVEDLASLCSMSESNFYKNFKQVTSMSPIQYIKRKRLLEARNLLLSFNYKAYEVSAKVGYISEQQFSRDYSKFFGRPPMQDVRLFIKS